MLAIDRPEFERQMSVLCAAYSLPVGDRSEAYWLAFNRLQVSEFARMVEHVIGPKGPEKMPTVSQMWRVRKELSKAAQTPGVPGTQDVLTAIVEQALIRFHLSEVQVRQAWNWIARDPGGPDCAILGVIIPQDPVEPTKYPAHRLLVSELEQVLR